MRLSIDPLLAATLHEQPPTNWATRLLFTSPNAMRLFTARPRLYQDLESGNPTLAAYAHILASSGTTFGSLISIGAGDGYVDLSLPLAWKALRYIPVDISQAMVEAAVETARQRSIVALGLVTDVENTSSFLEERLEAEAPPPRLVVCLGNMFGNLDQGERALLMRLRAILDGPQCRLMLSVALGEFPRPIDRATFDARVGWSDLRALLSAGVARRTGEDALRIEEAMADRLVVAAGASDVPGADALLLSDGPSGSPLLHLRRYAFPPLLNWLEQVFALNVVDAQDCALPSVEEVRLGIALLALRTTSPGTQ